MPRTRNSGSDRAGPGPRLQGLERVTQNWLGVEAGPGPCPGPARAGPDPRSERWFDSDPSDSNPSGLGGVRVTQTARVIPSPFPDNNNLRPAPAGPNLTRTQADILRPGLRDAGQRPPGPGARPCRASGQAPQAEGLPRPVGASRSPTTSQTVSEYLGLASSFQSESRLSESWRAAAAGGGPGT
jgi:hypothetical protein